VLFVMSMVWHRILWY